MNDERFFKVSVWFTILAMLFIAVYPLFSNYFFSKNQCLLLFYLFYLTLFLNFLGNYKNEENYRSKIKWIGSNFHSIIINIVIIGIFAVIITRADINIVAAFLILLSSQILLVATITLLKRQALTILFWVNFYLFTGTLIASQLPGISLDIVTRVNPYGGLFIFLFG
mgnify:CR=1 FL=1